jgi:bifunctional UDP-N-acetylglucosamine pyrophosphorylase/glucosamine-1-phosphate N-acetyltransferase
VSKGSSKILDKALKLAVVILAAGEGTRFNSKRPKVLHEIGGKPLLAHIIAAASRVVNERDIFAVIGHQANRVREALAVTGVRFIEQTERRGTGHAIQCASQTITGYENILVLAGDVPLIRTETIQQVVDFHLSHKASMTLLTAMHEELSGYGRVLRRSPESAEVEAIVERKALTPPQQTIREINSGIYAFKTASLLAHLDKLNTNNAQGELCLTDLAALLSSAGERVVAILAADAVEVSGADTIAELVALDATLRAESANRLMASGVTILRPETLCAIVRPHFGRC